MNMGETANGRLTQAAYLRVSTMLLAFLALAPSLGRAQMPEGNDVAGQLAGKTSRPRASLDFKLYRSYMIMVSGSVGGLKNLHFIIDTSASTSIADRRLVERLGARRQSRTLYVLGETVGAARAVLKDLRAGPLLAESLPVVTLDLAYLQQELGTRIDMLIGLDVLGQSSFSIDYHDKRMLFGELPALPLTIPMQSGPPLVSVSVWLDGKPFRLLVNTGFPALMLEGSNAEATAQNVKIAQSRLTLNVAGGQLALKQTSVRSVRLGDMELGPQPVFIVSEETKVFDGSLPIPGRFKEVAFDFEHHLLGLRR